MEDLITNQENLNFTITTPLGVNVLLIDSLTGAEQLSTPFEFHLKLHSKNPMINFQALIGKEVIVTFSLGEIKRYFAGIVGEIFQEQTAAETDTFRTRYQLKIYPTLWLLKFNSNHRIFQKMSTLDIIKQIFTDNKLTNYLDKTTQKGKTIREYCVQYGESAFDFVSRLMEQEGIFYFFQHTAEGHKLVLADDNTAFTQQPAKAIGVLKSLASAPLFNKILFCSFHQQVVPRSFATSDYNYKTPTTSLLATAPGTATGGGSVTGEVYRYPGLFSQSDEGEKLSTLRIQELEWSQETLQGTTTAVEFAPGYKFTVKDHLRASINTTYAAYRVHHTINQHTQALEPQEGANDTLLPLYENSFVAFDAQTPFSPPLVTPKPRIYSTQTAIVTGKDKEEIWTNDLGCVTVQFYWDRLGKNDEKSSCMIRVAQTWAMSGWGSLFTPRVGQEVVVTFLDGDPDRPLITGCVYNGTHLPPYPPDKEPTKSTIKSNTSTPGGGSKSVGFNEVRFEDKKDAEEIYIHAEKDMNRVVKHSRSLMIEEGDDLETIQKGSRTIMLSATGDATPEHSLTLVKGNDVIHLQEGDLMINIDKGNETIHLQEGDLTITIDKGNEVRTIQGNQSSTVSENYTIEATKNITLKATGDIIIEAGGSVSIKSGTDMTVNAGTNLSLQGSTATSLKGAQLMIQGSASTKIDGGASLQIMCSAMTQLQSPAGVKITAAMINLSGIVKLG